MAKSFRKTLALILSILMIISAVPMASMAADDGTFIYEINGEEATITGYLGSDPDVVIHDVIGEIYTVTALGYREDNLPVFHRNTYITSITLPDSITEIISGAFFGCTSLTYADLGKGVTKIGGNAFQDSGLTTIVIGAQVTTIEQFAFSACLEEIYFRGTEAQWNAINITENGNSILTDGNVEIVFNYGYNCEDGDHNFTNVAYKAPGCEDGNEAYTFCEICDLIFDAEGEPTDAESVVIPATHNWADATCTTPKACRDCGATEGEELGHTDDDDNGYCDVESCNALVCDHEDQELVTKNAVDVTCENDGFTGDKHCAKCDTKVEDGEVITHEGHDKIYHEAKEVTCSEPSWAAYETCRNCDYTTKVEVPAPGHTEQSDVYEAPTCNDVGYQGRVICSVCETVIAQGSIIPELGHNMELDEDRSYNSTCIRQGYNYYGCTNDGCDEYYDEHLDYAECVYSNWYVQDSATCNEEGLEIGVCSVCNIPRAFTIEALGHNYDLTTGDKNNDGTHTVYCTVCDEDTDGHSTFVDCDYDEVVTDPTCTADGYTTYTCTVCEYTYDGAETEAEGHDYGEWESNEDGTHSRVCGVCEDEEGRVDTDYCSFGEWEVTLDPDCVTDGEKERVCTECGYVDTAVVPALEHDEITHEAQEPTCTEIGWDAYVTCSRCDYTTYEEIEANGHEEVDHEAQAVTCLEPSWAAYVTCENCDYTTKIVVPAPGHNKTQHEAQDPTCTEIGWEAYEDCSRCDYTTYEEIEALGHEEIILPGTPATCTESGLEDGKYCEVCETVTLEKAVIEALGHDYEVDEENSKKSCTEENIIAEVCSLCGDKKATTVEPTGHKLSGWTTTKEPTCTEKGVVKAQCSKCFATVVDDADIIDHVDSNGDKACDMCKKSMSDSTTEKPEENKPDNDDTKVECACYCHTTGILRFFLFDIPLLFQRFFGLNRVCKCGALHYE